MIEPQQHVAVCSSIAVMVQPVSVSAAVQMMLHFDRLDDLTESYWTVNVDI